MLSSVAMVLLFAVLDARPEEKVLDDYKTIYEKSSQKLEREYQAKLEAGLGKYGKLLNQAIESMKSRCRHQGLRGREQRDQEVQGAAFRPGRG